METKPSAMDETLKKLEEGVKTLFTSEGYQKYLKTMAKFSSYSFNNTVLIASQRPDATLVAGYRAWQTKFGRQVKRGEKGIKIITPMKVTETKEVTLVDPLTHKIKRDADGRPMKELRDVTIPRFRVTTVFDISQTEGKELPVPEVHPLTASVPGYEDMLEAICRYSPVPITIEPVEGTDVNGFYHHVDKRIAVKEGLSQAQTIKTALHEVTHALLHDRDKLKQEGIQKDPHAREVEAESVAYTVSQAFGLDTSGYTFGYVASWSRSMELKELKQAMDIIRRTSAGMIDGIRGHLNDLRLEHLMEEPDLAVRVDAVRCGGSGGEHRQPPGQHRKRQDRRHPGVSGGSVPAGRPSGPGCPGRSDPAGPAGTGASGSAAGPDPLLRRGEHDPAGGGAVSGDPLPAGRPAGL